MDVARQSGIISCQVPGGEVLVHGVPVLYGVRLYDHRILAHLIDAHMHQDYHEGPLQAKHLVDGGHLTVDMNMCREELRFHILYREVRPYLTDPKNDEVNKAHT